MEKVYSISEITNKVKDILERNVGYVVLEGEISNYKAQSSGHLYFTLKDDNAAISAVMFKMRAVGLKFAIKDGLTVKASGQITVYQKRGVYQIVIDKMELSGEGDILRMLELRKQNWLVKVYSIQRGKDTCLFYLKRWQLLQVLREQLSKILLMFAQEGIQNCN